MNDNVLTCRERLFAIWSEEYTTHCKDDASDDAREAARFIISRNIINGNALTLMCVDDEGKDTSAPIVFSEWTLISGTQMQRSDYTMADLLLHRDTEDFPLFAALAEEEKEEVIKIEALSQRPVALGGGKADWESLHGKEFFEYLKKHPEIRG